MKEYMCFKGNIKPFNTVLSRWQQQCETFLAILFLKGREKQRALW